MRPLILILLSSLLLACGKETTPLPREILLELAEIRDKFSVYYGEDVTSFVNIFFVPLNYPTVGQCYYGLRGHAFINLDPDYWNKVSKVKKEILLFHEYGHCILLQVEHRNGNIEFNGNRVPASIMNAYLLDETVYSTYHEYYIQELFKIQ